MVFYLYKAGARIAHSYNATYYQMQSCSFYTITNRNRGKCKKNHFESQFK